MNEEGTTDREIMTAEQLIAAFTLDAPVPVRRLYGIYGSRTTFQYWQGLGLDVKRVPGMGPTVVPSAFRAFLMEQRGDSAPSHPPTPARAKERQKGRRRDV